MNWQFLNKIWKPDTFFVNGKKSKMHKITVPNRFLRITPNGEVSYSQRFELLFWFTFSRKKISCLFTFLRLTIHARCRMHLLKFPLDSQVCPLWIGSYGYASKDIIFEWRKPSGFSIDNQQTVSTFYFHTKKWSAICLLFLIRLNLTLRNMIKELSTTQPTDWSNLDFEMIRWLFCIFS